MQEHEEGDLDWYVIIIVHGPNLFAIINGHLERSELKRGTKIKSCECF